jgi:hypothetical protein
VAWRVHVETLQCYNSMAVRFRGIPAFSRDEQRANSSMPHMQHEEVRGQPITRLGQEVTPIARIAQFTWRGGRLEWYRPVAIAVRDEQGVRRVPIHDATRRAMGGIILAGLALGLGAGWIAGAAARGRTR